MSTENQAAAPAVEATQQAPVTPQQAPAPQPPVQAAPPAQEPAKAPAAEADQPYTYNATGNANVDYALGVIGNAGIGLEHPAVKLAMDGDFTQLRHVLASKGVAGSDALVEMIEREAKAEGEREAAEARQIGQDCVTMAGTPEHWENVVSWARQNAEPEEAEMINELLGKKGTHKIAATYLLTLYDRANGEREPQRSATSPDAGGRAAAPAGPLNRVQFAAEAAKLRQRLGDAYTGSPEYAALGRRLSV